MKPHINIVNLSDFFLQKLQLAFKIASHKYTMNQIKDMLKEDKLDTSYHKSFFTKYNGKVDIVNLTGAIFNIVFCFIV